MAPTPGKREGGEAPGKSNTIATQGGARTIDVRVTWHSHCFVISKDEERLPKRKFKSNQQKAKYMDPISR